MTGTNTAHQETRAAWNQNAAYWDSVMGEGNHFVEVLIWPATQRLLELQPGERVLDIGCGNGLYARKLAGLGAEVVALDFAEEMIAHARARTRENADRIAFRVLDATDEAALLELGEGRYDAAICQMALMDMAEIDPLMRAIPRLLRPGGRFVFSVMHPCFNQPSSFTVAETFDREGKLVTRYSVKVSAYLSALQARGEALHDQPALQFYFHRPLQILLGAGFQAGLVVDALEERAFPPDFPPGKDPLAWGSSFSEIPPVLVVRLRTRA